MSVVRKVQQQTLALPVSLDSFECPDCGTKRNMVIDTRQVKERRRRRRMCANGHRFSTYELSAERLAEIERKPAEFREWQSGMRDLLRTSVAS